MLNLTQHLASPEQVKAGVVDLQDGYLESLKQHLTFTGIPTKEDLEEAANDISYLVYTYNNGMTDIDVMIGGAPWFMPVLEKVLSRHGMNVHYAFSERVSEDKHNADGSVTKVAVFKHLGFYLAS